MTRRRKSASPREEDRVDQKEKAASAREEDRVDQKEKERATQRAEEEEKERKTLEQITPRQKNSADMATTTASSTGPMPAVSNGSTVSYQLCVQCPVE